MTKNEFVTALYEGLPEYHPTYVMAAAQYYIDEINGEMEDGASEEEAVWLLGDVRFIIDQIRRDNPIPENMKGKKYKNYTIWDEVARVLSAPVWLPVLILAAVAMTFFYVVLCLAVVLLWLVFAAIVLAAGVCLVAAITYYSEGLSGEGLLLIGLVCFFTGTSVYLLFGALSAAKGVIKLGKNLFLTLWKRFVGEDHT